MFVIITRLLPAFCFTHSAFCFRVTLHDFLFLKRTFPLHHPNPLYNLYKLPCVICHFYYQNRSGFLTSFAPQSNPPFGSAKVVFLFTFPKLIFSFFYLSIFKESLPFWPPTPLSFLPRCRGAKVVNFFAFRNFI